jgi:hypothetical protein
LTCHPTAEWTEQQLREAFGFNQSLRYLLRDRDAIFAPGLPRAGARHEHGRGAIDAEFALAASVCGAGEKCPGARRRCRNCT